MQPPADVQPPPQDYRKYFVLYVDDEERSLKSFERAFGHDFKILTASTAADGLRMFNEHSDEIAVLMTDQRMPGEQGVWLLDKARQLRPSALRILATAYADLPAMIQAVNTGAIYHFVVKPWDPPQLESILKHAIQLYSVQRERDELLREKMNVLHNMMVSDRIVSLGFMAAGMSHHIRNWLVAAKTFLDLVPQTLEEEGVDVARAKNPEFWTDYRRNAEQQIDRINSLLKDLWAVAETPALAFIDCVRLADVVRDTVTKLTEKLADRRIAVSIDVPESLPELTVDKAKFTRMFELLVRDEIVSLPEDSRLEISARRSSGGVRLSVRDNGPGLSQEILETIFDPFNARSDSPTEHGINLMACYFIVHYHGGRIHAQSAPGQGTEFIIDLPLNADRPVVAPQNPELLQKIRRTDELWEKLLASR